MKHWKAFSLIELLTVMVVAGVLALVTVPKLMRVLETRKTLEAEEMLLALRGEQEKRCVAGNAYQTDSSQLSMLNPANTGDNFSYTLQETGATASRTGKNYEIKMISYKTGKLCCSGVGCSELNKNYPTCTEAAATAALQDECAGEGLCNQDERPDSSKACDVGVGLEVREIYCFGGVWHTGEWDSSNCGCDADSKPATSEACPEGLDGTKTRTVTCTEGTWITGEWNEDGCHCNPDTDENHCCSESQVWSEDKGRCCDPNVPGDCACVDECEAKGGIKLSIEGDACACLVCPEGSGLTYDLTNPSNPRCACAVSRESCVASGQVFVDLSGASNPDDRQCGCQSCEELATTYNGVDSSSISPWLARILDRKGYSGFGSSGSGSSGTGGKFGSTGSGAFGGYSGGSSGSSGDSDSGALIYIGNGNQASALSIFNNHSSSAGNVESYFTTVNGAYSPDGTSCIVPCQTGQSYTREQCQSVGLVWQVDPSSIASPTNFTITISDDSTISYAMEGCNSCATCENASGGAGDSWSYAGTSQSGLVDQYCDGSGCLSGCSEKTCTLQDSDCSGDKTVNPDTCTCSCEMNESTCAAQGKYYVSSGCRCKSCSEYQGNFLASNWVYSGMTSTGKPVDCEKTCPDSVAAACTAQEPFQASECRCRCPYNATNCGSEGKWYDSETCSCQSECPTGMRGNWEYFGGAPGNGSIGSCERVCRLNCSGANSVPDDTCRTCVADSDFTGDCIAEGKAIVPLGEGYVCMSCHEYNPTQFVEGASRTFDGYVSSCANTECTLTGSSCAARNKVLLDSDSGDCFCGSCQQWQERQNNGVAWDSNATANEDGLSCSTCPRPE